MSGTLYFAAKAPRPGTVKTRLAPELGAEGAAALYRAFLADLAARFKDTDLELGWFVPPGSWPEVRTVVGPQPSHPRLRFQRGADWGERQQNLFREAEGPELPLVLTATDSPQLEVWRVKVAFQALEEADVVFGPTHDGGYYLVGMNTCHEVLGGVRMSTGTALEDARRRAARLGLKVALIPPTFDVDEAGDLRLLAAEVAVRNDLANTGLALGRLRTHAHA